MAPSTGFVGISAPRSLDPSAYAIRADVRLISGRGSVWVALTGFDGTLAVAQAGMLDRGAGPRVFLAWGNGDPGQPGSHYTECDHGPGDHEFHDFRVSRSGGFVKFVMDGLPLLWLTDTPENIPWSTGYAQTFAESHSATMPGGKVLHLLVDGAMSSSFGQTQGIGNDATVVWFAGIGINDPDGFRVWP